MRRVICLILFLLLVSRPTWSTNGIAQNSTAVELNETTLTEVEINRSVDSSLVVDQLTQQIEGPLEASDIAATTSWIQATGITEWLGPLAPLALSPFFGVTCLSGISLWGPSWAADNSMLGTTGALRSELIFAIFLMLTILTSVPRFTKVSKPIAQAVDRLEAYAVIVILLVIKIAASIESSGDESIAMIQLGMLSFTLDSLLAVAMIINVLIINSVKFFFEFLVWLTPVPFLDGVFEICNKSLCLFLMAVYAFSPTLATVVNLAFFLVAAILFRWISRRVRFYRTMMLDPVLAKLWPAYGKPRHRELIVFNRNEFGPFPAKSRLWIRCGDNVEDGWHLREANWWMPAHEHTLTASQNAEVSRGWVMNTIDFGEDPSSGTARVLTFSRRYNGDALRMMLEQLNLPMGEVSVESTEAGLQAEFC